MNKLQHWLLNSNLGTTIIIGLISFAVTGTLRFLDIENRVTNIEKSHIIFHYYDAIGHCVVLEHNKNYYCIPIEEQGN